jgi:protein tyrosine phosphatase type 4A
VLAKWITLLKSLQEQRTAPGSPNKTREATSEDEPASSKTTIALHCVAGLGRAPLLVAIALIESGMSPLKAIEYVRKRRQGAFNSKQLQYLLKYKRANHECSIL